MRTSALERPEAPPASAPFSKRVTRRAPRAASAYAMLIPLTPPPTTTTSAVSAIGSLPVVQWTHERAGHRADVRGLAEAQDGVVQRPAAGLAEAGRRQGAELLRQLVVGHGVFRIP